MKYYLFAKYFQHVSVETLMDYCAQAGLDGPTALIRHGYWTEEKSLRKELPRFVATADAAGLEVQFASTGLRMADLATDSGPLQILADNGIKAARLGYIPRSTVPHVRDLHGYAREMVERTARAAEKCGIKAVIQIHGGQYPHSATAAYFLVRDLDPAFIGIMIDPGNNICQEGYEHYSYQMPLLGEYVAAVGAKDGCTTRSGDPESPSKGWRKRFVPVYEGETNWEELYDELDNIGCSGAMVLMPFYDTEDLDLLVEKLGEEVSYLKRIERGCRNGAEE